MDIVSSIFKKEYSDLSGQLETVIKPWMFFTCIGVAIALGLAVIFLFLARSEKFVCLFELGYEIVKLLKVEVSFQRYVALV